jgi:hypothetical protein
MAIDPVADIVDCMGLFGFRQHAVGHDAWIMRANSAGTATASGTPPPLHFLHVRIDRC